MKKNKLPFFVIPFLILLGLLGLRLSFQDKFEEFSYSVFDRYQQIRPRAYEPAPVHFVDIDDESLAKYGQWPWPRTRVAELLSKLKEKGAAVVAMDILFAESDRTSPANILPLWKFYLPELESFSKEIEKMPDHDQILAEKMKELPVITGFSLTANPTSFHINPKAGFAFKGDDPNEFLKSFRGVIPPIEPLEKAAAGLGSINFIGDTDGILRRVPLIYQLQGQSNPVPSLVAEALRVAQGASNYVVTSSGGSGEISYGAHTGIVNVKIGREIIPTDSQGRIWLYDTGKIKQRYIPAWQIFEDKEEASLIQDSILFIGTSAEGLKDLRPTPLNPVASGTEIHVQLTEQILLQNFLVRPDWARGAEIIFFLFLGLLLILLLPRTGAIACAVLAFAAIGGAFGFSWYAFTHKHWLLDPVTPSLASLVMYLTVSLMNYLRTESEKKQVRSAFSMYVSPALLKKISEQPDALRLGGEMRPMSILFADIRNFTSIAEQLSAQELTQFMNRYLTPMTDIILQHGGTIDKYMGDCIMAFWNAPLNDPDHEKHACQAALAMQIHLKKWNEKTSEEFQRAGKKFHSIAVGIGLNTGECCVGNMGSDQRFDYSVLGDDVNLASRLESQSKFYGVDIVVGQNIFEKVPDLMCLELDLIRVKGKQKPVKIFGLWNSQGKEASSYKKLLDPHQRMLEAYRSKRWMEAEELLSLLIKIQDGFSLETLYSLYHQRIQDSKRNPPDAGWDGSYSAPTK